MSNALFGLVFTPVWESNFGRPTPSTRRAEVRSCVCSTSWRFYAIDATLSPQSRRLDGVETHTKVHAMFPHRFMRR